MKRRTRRVIGWGLAGGLALTVALVLLQMSSGTPLLADRARQIYTFAPGSSGSLGWETEHSFLYAFRPPAFGRGSSTQAVYHIYDVESHDDKQVKYGPGLVRPLILSRAYFPESAFKKALETYAKQVASGPQGHADIHLENGKNFNQIWPLASFAGTSHVVFADRIIRSPSTLEKLWLQYIVHKPIPRPRDCVRIWTCRRDGTHLHLVGEGPIMPIVRQPTMGSAVYTLQQCQLSEDEKTLRFVWGGGIWSVPVED